MSEPTTPAPAATPQPIGEVVVTPRPLSDYRNMFLLDDWSYLGSPEAVVRAFEVAAELFATDYAPDGRRYVAAELPTLPFGDGWFRLTLSSHLLFVYPDQLDFDWHLASLLELVRVTAGEVRVYPVVDTVGRAYPRLDELRAALDGLAVRSELRTANCAWQPGGDQLLACWRR